MDHPLRPAVLTRRQPAAVHAAVRRGRGLRRHQGADRPGILPLLPVRGVRSNPDFRRRSLRSNLVFRWEYAPGSTLFLVWAQSRSAFDDDPRLGAGDLASSFTDDGDNIWLAKVNYWLRL